MRPNTHEDQTGIPLCLGSGSVVNPFGRNEVHALSGMTLALLSTPSTNWLVQKSHSTWPLLASRQYTNPYAPLSPSPNPTYTLPFTTSGEVHPSALAPSAPTSSFLSL